ncbi:MAG: LPXTG cell wall anchor domain-containing protein [Lachnospiraceae bacterium]|nr:LPXTG cell wall anchor domain-containing protein [Lachnospiraceae bacterium]
MSRKSNKTLLFVGLAALVAGGAYYYYKKKVKDADFDDFDDFEDDDTELEDYLRESAYQSEQKERSIKDVFPINLSSQGVSEAKESLKKVVLDLSEKVTGAISKDQSSVVKSGDDADVKDFSFYDLSAEDDDFVKEDKPLDVIDPARDSASSDAGAASYLDQVAAADEAAEAVETVAESVQEAVETTAEAVETAAEAAETETFEFVENEADAEEEKTSDEV